MLAGQSPLIALTISSNMLSVLLTKLLQGILNDGKATRSTHGLSGEVGVATSTIPVARDGLGVIGNNHTKVLAHAGQQVARHPHVVTRVNSHRGTHLILPLARHHLSINTRDVDASIQAGLVMGLHYGSAVGILSTITAIVRALGKRVTRLGPAERSHTISLEQSVLLLNAEPGQQILGSLHDLSALGSSVAEDGLAVGLVAVAHHKDVAASTERIREDSLGLDDDLGILTRGLASGRTIEVPVRKLAGRGGYEVQGLGLRTDVRAGTTNPDVLSHDLAVLLQGRELVLNRHVQGGLLGEDRVGHFHCTVGEKGSKFCKPR
mmetsp:Transcript_43594/g.76881  ORF Transcript_43594/g.76881 Transcript_43594/m.76881 type:complete len:321 (+) Transcript_43594:465-1427(+)